MKLQNRNFVTFSEEGSELPTDEFSTCHTTDEVISIEETIKREFRTKTYSTVSECSEFSTSH